MRLLLTRADIPPIAWQAPFPGRQPGARRVDGLVESWRLVVEADGRASHEGVRDFERDRRRDDEGAAAGLQTLRITWQQITSAPTRWVGDVLACGSHRRAARRGARKC